MRARGNLGLTYIQPLIDLTVFPPPIAQAGSRRSCARLQHQFTVRGTLYGVMGAYYEVLKQQRLGRQSIAETLRLSGDQLDLAQKRADGQSEVTRADVALRATVTVETARRVLVEDDNIHFELDHQHAAAISWNYAPDAPVDLEEPPDAIPARCRASRTC